MLLNRQNGRPTFAIVAVEQNQPASVQDAVRDTSKLLKSRSAAQAAALTPCRVCPEVCSTSQFLTHGGSPDTLVNAITSTQNECSAVIAPACCASSGSLSHVGRGNQPGELLVCTFVPRK